MRFQLLAAPLLAVAVSATPELASTTTTQLPACTATSHTGSGGFFDLRPDRATAPDDKKKGLSKDYFSKGYDYGKNFTLNICGAVVDSVTNVVGLDAPMWQNVSAYYMSHGEVFSIGSESADLQSRGRKLILQYTGGSPCGEDAQAIGKASRDIEYGFGDADDDDRREGEEGSPDKTDDKSDDNPRDKTRRKSTIISFHCDRDPGSTQASVSFVGTDPDECAYFFEARSLHACAQAEPHKPGSVGPGSIFGLILVIAVLVYLLGGIFYNRTVAHARGWRQLPNYSLWAGIWNFICETSLYCCTCCLRRIGVRRGYRQVSSDPTRRDGSPDSENRLIDQLDEEWDD